ncbi:MAG: 30S ribosomal protein S16 [Ignavibacteriales bacterium]|nr:MAG: 30S ribosomal protein S16 [Ignavibacteriales bacterium]
MAVKLRLRRMGKKRQPYYKLVAADSRSPRDGKFLEAVGIYNPMTQPHQLEISEEAAIKWLQNGAQPTDTVKSLLSQKGIMLKYDLLKRGLAPEAIEAEVASWQKLKETAAANKTAKKAKKKSKGTEGA